MGNLIHRGKGSFTHVENTIFFERGLSAKAKGVYCQIRSLETNPDWVFTIAGFATLFKDGIDSIKSALKELEAFGFLIRARKRASNGKFVSAEESIWITLDDPSMYEEEIAELKNDDFMITSKLISDASIKHEESSDSVKSCQVKTRSGFSTRGESTCGSSTNGQTTCGESAPINPLAHQSLSESKNPSLAPPSKAQPRAKGTTDFPEDFERLCAMSLKPVVALSFKRDCFDAWNHRVQEGYSPKQILDAYDSYARSYKRRNGTDNSKAKNLASWLTREGGLVDFADDPERCYATNEDGSPLSMEDLAGRYKRFGKLWKKARGRRGLVLSLLYDRNPNLTKKELEEGLQDDRQYCDFMDACRIAYNQYLRCVDPDNFYGLVHEESPFMSTDLMTFIARKEEIRALANDDPDFAELLDRYETFSKDTTTCRLIGQLDDKAWERRRYEELQLQHEIEDRLRAHQRSAHSSRSDSNHDEE